MICGMILVESLTVILGLGRGIFFIEPNDEEFKLTMQAARRKLEVPMPAAMPCKIPIKSSGKNPPQYWETQDKIRLCC